MGCKIREIISLNEVNNNVVVSKILRVCYKKHSSLPLLFFSWAGFFLQFRCQQIGSLHLAREKSGHVRSLSYGPEPNLDMYAV